MSGSRANLAERLRTGYIQLVGIIWSPEPVARGAPRHRGRCRCQKPASTHVVPFYSEFHFISLILLAFPCYSLWTVSVNASVSHFRRELPNPSPCQQVTGWSCLITPLASAQSGTFSSFVFASLTIYFHVLCCLPTLYLLSNHAINLWILFFSKRNSWKYPLLWLSFLSLPREKKKETRRLSSHLSWQLINKNSSQASLSPSLSGRWLHANQKATISRARIKSKNHYHIRDKSTDIMKMTRLPKKL